jgi:hypothetical protein
VGNSGPTFMSTPTPTSVGTPISGAPATVPGPKTPNPLSSSPAAKARDRIDWWKDVTSIFQSIATVLALLAAGWWFEAQGFSSPHANATQTLETLKIHDNWRLVRVTVHISNVGVVPLKLDTGTVYIARVYPLEDAISDLMKNGGSPIDQSRGQIPWPVIGKPYTVTPHSKLWPNESESYYFDFLIPTNLCEIMAYSQFVNDSHKRLVWSASTLQPLEDCQK